ncbi:uncharacterized protein LOC108674626 [Hyalella azteca]|uniref:Uncharacterized protein LOC108674626 n=1 Tax=Hyalella azteca TaxID=294128 RepID=A0A8B7NWD9_HYAAZ|nr:uncharacterized protein LOC108674626 [Hyalella azteca]
MGFPMRTTFLVCVWLLVCQSSCAYRQDQESDGRRRRQLDFGDDFDPSIRRGPVGSIPGTVALTGFNLEEENNEGFIPIFKPQDGDRKQNIPIRALSTKTNYVFVSSTVTNTVFEDLTSNVFAVQPGPPKTVVFTQCTHVQKVGVPTVVYSTVLLPASTVTSFVRKEITITAEYTPLTTQGRTRTSSVHDTSSSGPGMTMHYNHPTGYYYDVPKIPFTLPKLRSENH